MSVYIPIGPSLTGVPNTFRIGKFKIDNFSSIASCISELVEDWYIVVMGGIIQLKFVHFSQMR